MSFTAEERELIREIINPTVITDNDISQHVNTDVYNFLKSKNHLSTLRDRIFFLNKNKFRPYDSCTMTKFLHSDLDCSSIIDQISGSISPNFLIFIDFHFLFESKPEERNQNYTDSLKLQRASKASAMNETLKIVTQNNYESLKKEFQNKTHADLLNRAYQHHCDLYEFQNSGLRPYQLLSLVVHIQKFG